MRATTTRAALARSALLVALGLAGCGGGDGGMERRYATSGTVTYKGAPVAHGEIAFAPVDPAQGRAASSPVVDGAFALTTMTDRDGAVPGQYRVSVSAQQGEPPSGRPGGKNARDPAVVRETARAMKNILPKKYESTASSPLTAEVKAESNKFTFDLVD